MVARVCWVTLMVARVYWVTLMVVFESLGQSTLYFVCTLIKSEP